MNEKVKTQPKTRTSLTIDVDLLEWLRGFAYSKKISVSEAIGLCLRNFMEEEERKKNNV